MRQQTPTYKLNDFHIYGSSRLGVRQEDLSITSTGSSTLDLTYRELGNKRYELTNHLGNVLEVISDRKLAKEEVTRHAKFNGSGQYINLGTGSRGVVNEVTVEFMMKTTTNSSAGQAIVSDYGNPNVYGGYTVFLKQGKIEMRGRNSSDGIYKISGSNGTISVADGQWHHIAAVITPSDVWEVYIDGVLSESVNYGSTVNDLTNGVNLTIGRHYYNGLNYSGELKEVSIWNRAKSQSEIQQDRTSYFVGNETNLVSYLKLDEPTGGYQDKVTGGHYNNSPRPTSIAEGSVYYTADVISYSDYYPFGMLMPNRYTGGSKYRYSFNGMEKDNEIAGDGNSFTTHFRQYDSRIARWTSIDPVTHQHMSPYNAFDGNPIYFSDPSGADSEGGETDPPKDCPECKPSVMLKEFVVTAEADIKSTPITPIPFRLPDNVKKPVSWADKFLSLTNALSATADMVLINEKLQKTLTVVKNLGYSGTPYVYLEGIHEFSSNGSNAFNNVAQQEGSVVVNSSKYKIINGVKWLAKGFVYLNIATDGIVTGDKMIQLLNEGETGKAVAQGTFFGARTTGNIMALTSTSAARVMIMFYVVYTADYHYMGHLDAHDVDDLLDKDDYYRRSPGDDYQHDAYDFD